MATENSELSCRRPPREMSLNLFSGFFILVFYFFYFFMSDSPLVIFSALHQQGLIDTYLFPVPE